MDENANLYAHFKENFPADLDTQLLSTPQGRSVSYAQADEFSARIANALRELGASPGDRVTVQVEKTVESLFLYLACLRSALVYHPLNTAYTESELKHFLDDAEPSIVICDSRSRGKMQSALPVEAGKFLGADALLTLDADGGGTLMELAISARCEADIAFCNGEDMAALLYSSGTTGTPKGIVLSHENLRWNAETLVRVWGFSASDRLLHMLPIYHVHGLFVATGCVLMSGASMSWHASFSDQAAIASMVDCTVMMGVPTYYSRLLGNPDFGVQCSSNMRLFVSGSAPLLPATFFDFKRRSGHTILERYGMTETGMNTSNPLSEERRVGTVGPALPGVDIRIVDECGKLLEQGRAGNLQVKGPNVFSGYWRMPQRTAEDFTDDGFFNTGDKASMDPNGYISIVGRAKDLIICGGLNVYPKEVEVVIDDMPGVKESAVIGTAHPDFGEVVLAVIVAEGDAPSAEDVIANCKSLLANYKVPKRVEWLATLPRNPMGKVQKNLLREHFCAASQISG